MYLRQAILCRRCSLVPAMKRFITSVNSEPKDSKVTETVEFETIYKFPYIRHAALVSKIKMYTAAFGLLGAPTCGVLSAAGQMTMDAVYVAAYLGFTSTVAFTILSLPIKNLIGFLYISKDDQYIKISYLDFWGKRKNKIVKVEEWVPLSELPIRKLNILYLSPHLESHPEQFKLIVKLGGTLDKKKMGVFIE